MKDNLFTHIKCYLKKQKLKKRRVGMDNKQEE